MSQATEVKCAFKRGDLVQHGKFPGKVWRIWWVYEPLSTVFAIRDGVALPDEGKFGHKLGLAAEVDWLCYDAEDFSLVPEVTPPQVEEVKAPCEGGHTFEYGDLIEGVGKYSPHLNCGKYKAKYDVVTHSRPSECEGDNCIAFCAPEDFHRVDKPLDYREMKAAGIDGNGWQPRYLKIAAKAGQWQLKDGKVVLSPPPEPEPEVKATFQFGDLVEWTEGGEIAFDLLTKYHKYAVVAGVSMPCDKGYMPIAYCHPEQFKKLKEPTGYVDMRAAGVWCDGSSEDWLTLVAKAGQWHLKDGTVVLSPEVKAPVTPKISEPLFKFRDLVTHTNPTTGVVTEWEVVGNVPDEHDMIYLGKRGEWNINEPMNPCYLQNVWGLSQFNAGKYRCAYETDVVLDTPKQTTTCSSKCCGSCDKPVVNNFHRGDLVGHEWSGKLAVVSDELDEGTWVTACKPEYLHDTYEEDNYEDIDERLDCDAADGYLPKSLKLIAPAGSWTMISGHPVLVPEPVPEPVVHQFKEGDKVRVVKAMPEWRYWKYEMTLAVGGSGEIHELHTYADDGLTAAYVTVDTTHESFFYPLSCLELVPPQPSFKPGDMVVDANDQLWDVDGVTREGSVWISSKALVGIKLVSASTLKKVVFGTL